MAGDCNIELLCDICDSKEHTSFRCPIQNESKAVAQSVGYAIDALGAYYIPHPSI